MSDNRIVDSIMQHNVDLRKENSELRQRQAELVQRAEAAEGLLREWFEPIAAGTYGTGYGVRCLHCKVEARLGERLRHTEDCLLKRTAAHLNAIKNDI